MHINYCLSHLGRQSTINATSEEGLRTSSDGFRPPIGLVLARVASSALLCHSATFRFAYPRLHYFLLPPYSTLPAGKSVAVTEAIITPILVLFVFHAQVDSFLINARQMSWESKDLQHGKVTQDKTSPKSKYEPRGDCSSLP